MTIYKSLKTKARYTKKAPKSRRVHSDNIKQKHSNVIISNHISKKEHKEEYSFINSEIKLSYFLSTVKLNPF
jgi:hypothetical protein